MSNRAWVTLATNDSYGLGALVLAHSLRRVGSTYPVVVLITPSVTEAMRERLRAVFAEVITVDVLDSQDAAHLALLQRPELGITFTKIHCWSLTQYEKCVFLDADTLVVQNSDELFDREELSAAPDVGWPDCFNSGVFVFSPSQDTFDKLIKFAQERGSFDGGDQGLLNAFFSDWAHDDIKKHLPFLYNVTSAAFYSYLPALKHYGQNLKIIHFIGAAKPWLQQFNWESRTVDAPDHIRELLQLWWDLFVSDVHSQLDTTMTGVAGNLARVIPGSAGVPREAIDELTRRQGWEAGNIDYMGADAFENIWAKISQTLNQPRTSPPKEAPKEATPPPKQPSPPKEPSLPKESSPPKQPSPPKEPSTPKEPLPSKEPSPPKKPSPPKQLSPPKEPSLPKEAPAKPEGPQVAVPAPKEPVEAAVEPTVAISPAVEAASDVPAKPEQLAQAPVKTEEAKPPQIEEEPKVVPQQKTEVPLTPPASPASEPSTPVAETPKPVVPEPSPKESAAAIETAPASPSAPEAPLATPQATPEKASEPKTSTDSPPLANTPSKEDAPSVPVAKLEERRKPAGKLQLCPPVADPLPTPDSELEDAASLAHAIIASELATPTVTSPSPPVLPSPQPPLQEKRLSVDEPEVPTPPIGNVSLAQIGVKPKTKATTAALIESSVSETPVSEAAASAEPKKKVIKKVVKKEGSGAEAPVPPPRKKEKKPKDK